MSATTQAAATASARRAPDLVLSGTATGVLAIVFSTSPVALNRTLPLALLALVLYAIPRRVNRLRRSWRIVLAVTGMGLSATAAAMVVGFPT